MQQGYCSIAVWKVVLKLHASVGFYSVLIIFAIRFQAWHEANYAVKNRPTS